jgi:hypothetical protein
MKHKTTNINVLVSDEFNDVINNVAGMRRTTKSAFNANNGTGLLPTELPECAK